ncbi:hypothetical protein D9758_000864 [Tetrapyrgos nigripes]|uniref:Nudix hydrolase domain-containing protein n=1 Tax=Tetrapyrgos nigripes TaxID=182062 RepID=A0A8H5GZ33_9AGAR|nr:hypothetical protein D9758_000864 [Tetrapyrgos nigripes]
MILVLPHLRGQLLHPLKFFRCRSILTKLPDTGQWSAFYSLAESHSNMAQHRQQSRTNSNKAGLKSRDAQIPRPSASLVIINDKDEILLVQRTMKASAFAGVTVFPGGNYDSKQDSSIRMTAIRETFEESGLLIARPTSSSSKMPSDSILDKARHDIHSNKLLFKSFLEEHGLEADVESLMPFTEWITPRGAPRRFHARFFVTFLPAASSTGFKSGDKQERLPTAGTQPLKNALAFRSNANFFISFLPPSPDGGQEVVTARFLHPSAAFSEFQAGKITFMPPQYYILTTISQILSTYNDRDTQREKIRQLSDGLFGKMVINPRRLDGGTDGPGVLTYEGDETRGGKKGRLHRSEVLVGKGGITSKIILHRNFDIFTEIEGHLFNKEETEKAKL